MRSAIILLAKIAAALAVTASAVVSFYAAVNAAAVYTDLNVFVAGVATTVIGVVLGPLFCFFAA